MCAERATWVRCWSLALGGVLACGLASPAQAAGPIRSSSLGFRPQSVKTATFLTGDRFTVRRASDGLAVFSAPLGEAVRDAVTGQSVHIADFSAVRASGSYYLELPSCERSATFRIASDVYREAYRTMMLGFYGQRCGTAVSLSHGGATLQHAPCHTADVDLSYFDGAGQAQRITGGWHDAGDYGRYTVNGGFSAALMLRAWEDFSAQLAPIELAIPEAAGPLPDFLAETRWQLDWLLAMEYADGSGRFSNALKSPEFAPFVAPENDPSPIALAPASSIASAVAAAVLAQAARVYRSFDVAFADRCQQAAQRAYQWLSANPGSSSPAEEWAAAYDYGDTPGDATAQTLEAAARLWAAAELWASTDNAAALADFEERARSTAFAFSAAPDWVDPSDLGISSYLRSASAGRAPDVIAGLEASVLAAATSLKAAHDATDNGWGRAQGYWWGANGTTARSCLVLEMAQRLDGNAAWRDLCVEQIGYLLGRNPYGRSQVTGIGLDPPLSPHHRPSTGVVPPWPGLLMGGPQQNGADFLDWKDDASDYFTNETAINWNAALVYAFAGLLAEEPAGTNPAPGAGSDETDGTQCGPDLSGGADAGVDAGGTTDAGMPDTSSPLFPVNEDLANGSAAPDASCDCRISSQPRRGALLGLTGVALLWAVRRRRLLQ